MNRRTLLVAGASVAALSLLSSCATPRDPAARGQAIDDGVDRALSQLYEQAGGSRELVSSAKGVLVFPNVVEAGFLVTVPTGQGALRKGGKTVRFYRLMAVSAGLIIGAHSRAMYYLFMTDDALKRFEASSGWTVGTDASVALISVGATAQVDTRNVQAPVIGFVLTNAGVMANLSLDGTRIAPPDL